MTKIDVGLSPAPVFRDGLTSTLTYAILAVKKADEYNCICLSNYRTLKFYPDYEFWGVTPEQLASIALTDQYSRDDYQGVHNADTNGVKKLLEIVRGQRGTTVVPTDRIPGVFDTPYDMRVAGRRLHPETSRIPAIAFLPTKAEAKDKIKEIIDLMPKQLTA